MQTRGHVDEYP